MKAMTLYCKCLACGGTRSTKMTFNEGQKNELPAGSPCPLCDDGYCEYGATGGQFEKICNERDELLYLLYCISRDCTEPETRSRAAAFVQGKVGRAMDYAIRRGLTMPK